MVLVLAACVACARSESPVAAAAACELPPLILVHGLDQGPELFAPLIAAIEKQGVPGACVHAIRLEPANGDNIRAAEAQLAPFVEAVLRETNRARATRRQPPIEKVYLLGHSMGALSARWYAAVLHPERVALFIATSGANHGTRWQCEHPFGAGHQQMCPPFAADAAHSALQFRLNGAPGPDVDETPHGLGNDSPGVHSVPADAARALVYLTLRTNDDRYILPADSLLLDGAGGLAREPDAALATATSPGNFLLRVQSGHDELLSSPAAVRWLAQVIRASAGQATVNDSKDRS